MKRVEDARGGELKALSLTQPWATLVAIGAKRIETRSWNTHHRGPLAIHASKGFPRWAIELGLTEPFRSALRGHVRTMGDLPRGAIVAIVDLWDTFPTHQMALSPDGTLESISEQERAFGDYSPGRFGWRLRDVQPLAEPIPCKGALGLWMAPPLRGNG